MIGRLKRMIRDWHLIAVGRGDEVAMMDDKELREFERDHGLKLE